MARALLADENGPFAVRAITRNASSDKARAFDRAYGVFCVTNFWEHFSPHKELQQAGNLAEAARRAGAQHAIWSTLEDTRRWVPLDDDRMPTLMGEYKVPHFDAKGAANELFREAGVPTTFLLTSFYWDNFIHLGSGPQKGPDGSYAVTFPMDDKPLPGIGVEDIGKCAYGIFKRGDELIGETIGIAGEHLTGAAMARKLSETLGIEVGYNNVPPEVYRSFDLPGADDLDNMFQFKRDFNDDFVGARTIETARDLNPELQDLSTWLARHKEEIPL